MASDCPDPSIAKYKWPGKKKVWTWQVCVPYLFSTVPSSGTFQQKCGLVCLFSNLGAFFSPETMYVFSNCRSTSQGLLQLSNVQKAFLLSVWNLPLSHIVCHPCLFLIHPSFRFSEFSHSSSQLCLHWTKAFWHASLFLMRGPLIASDCLCHPSLAFQFCYILLTKGSQTCSHYSRCKLLLIVKSFGLARIFAVLHNSPIYCNISISYH